MSQMRRFIRVSRAWLRANVIYRALHKLHARSLIEEH